MKLARLDSPAARRIAASCGPCHLPIALHPSTQSWRGPLLGDVLKAAGMNDRARYIVFHCADDSNGRPYYESIDLNDAFHPQTILALLMNDHRLAVPHGAPVRLRVERQLGYKHAKFVMRIEARERIDDLYLGKGGFWEDRADYAWYAGI